MALVDKFNSSKVSNTERESEKITQFAFSLGMIEKMFLIWL